MKTLLRAALAAAWFCVAASVMGVDSTAYYLSGGAFSGPKGGSITVTLNRQGVPGSCANWTFPDPISTTVTLKPSGTNGLQANDIGGYWQRYYDYSGNPYWTSNVTFQEDYYATSFTIPLSQDGAASSDRTGTLSVDTYCGVPKSPFTNATVTIFDNNSTIGVGVLSGTSLTNSISILEGGVSNSDQVVLRFTRDQANVSARTISYMTNGSTAVAGTDYVPILPAVTIAAGATNYDLTITATNASQSANKILAVQLATGTYKTSLTRTNATVTILADYPTVDIGVTNYTATDGESSTAFVISREQPPFVTSGARAIYYSLSGTAVNGVDFTPTLPGNATIPAGQWYCLVPISPVFQANVVGTKELTLTLSNSTTYTLGTNTSATIGLLQDAPIVNVTASGAYAQAGGYTGQFQVARSGALGSPLTVNLAVDGTALPGTDYTAIPTSVRFAAGQTKTNLNVVPLVNPPVQGKTVVLSLPANSSYYLGDYTNAIVTILAPNTPATSTNVVGRYWRGTGSDPTYWSMVVPLDYQKGVVFSNLFGNTAIPQEFEEMAGTFR